MKLPNRRAATASLRRPPCERNCHRTCANEPAAQPPERDGSRPVRPREGPGLAPRVAQPRLAHEQARLVGPPDRRAVRCPLARQPRRGARLGAARRADVRRSRAGDRRGPRGPALLRHLVAPARRVYRAATLATCPAGGPTLLPEPDVVLRASEPDRGMFPPITGVSEARVVRSRARRRARLYWRLPHARHLQP